MSVPLDAQEAEKEGNVDLFQASSASPVFQEAVVLLKKDLATMKKMHEDYERLSGAHKTLHQNHRAYVDHHKDLLPQLNEVVAELKAFYKEREERLKIKKKEAPQVNEKTNGPTTISPPRVEKAAEIVN